MALLSFALLYGARLTAKLARKLSPRRLYDASGANQVNAHRLKMSACAGAAAAALLALAACQAPATRATAPGPQIPAADERAPVYVVKRGWHIDIGIAQSEVQPSLRPVAAAFPESRYLLFGFGERRYLLHGGGVGNSVAALWGGAGLVVVTSIGAQHLEQVFGSDSVVRVALTAQQMSDLQAFIEGTFATREGAVVRVTPGPHAVGSFSAYYESAQGYSALHTCNTWAAEALHSAHLPVSSSGVEFSWQLWHQVQRLANAGATLGFLVGCCGRGASPKGRVAKRDTKVRVSIHTAIAGRLCRSIRRLSGCITSCAAGICAGESGDSS